MKKIVSVIIFSTIFISILFSGCQEEEQQNNNQLSDKVELESDIVELVYSEIVTNEIQAGIITVDVKYLFKNILDRDVSIQVLVEFYNENDEKLGEDTRTIDLLRNVTETFVSPANIVTYDDTDAIEVDHVKIIVTERVLD